MTGWTPSTCTASKYEATLGTTITGFVNAGYMSVDHTKNPAVLTIKKEMPLDKVGKHTYSIVPYTFGKETKLTNSKWAATVELELIHPCKAAVAAVPTVEKQTYIIGKAALVLNWAAFTFTPTSPCNDGSTIAFPTHYAGTYARQGTALTNEEKNTPPVTIAVVDSKKSWKIETDGKAYAGTYHLVLTASYDGTALSKTQTIVLTIQEECEPPTVKLPDVSKASYKWAPGQAPLTIKVPALTLTPTTCKITYVVTIPKALKDLAKVSAENGDIMVAGAAPPTLVGKYKFTVQGKTAGGILIEAGKYELEFELKEAKKKPAGDLVTTVTSVANAAATAARGPRGPRPTRGGGPKLPGKTGGGTTPTGGDSGTGKGPGGKDGGKGPGGDKGGKDSFDVDGGGEGGKDEFGGSDFAEGDGGDGGGDGGDGGGEDEGKDSSADFSLHDGVESFDFSI